MTKPRAWFKPVEEAYGGGDYLRSIPTEDSGWEPLYDQAALDAATEEGRNYNIAEIQRLRTALEKIADWDSNWGPFPEGNEAWRAMAVITAREATRNNHENQDK